MVSHQVDIHMNGEYVETMSPSVPDGPHTKTDREIRTHEATPRISTSYELYRRKLSGHNYLCINCLCIKYQYINYFNTNCLVKLPVTFNK